MQNINVYLRETVRDISEKNVFIAPNIGDKKLNNAIKAFRYEGIPGNVIAIFDNTLLGSGKDGLLFTGDQLIYRPSFSDPITILYSSIVKIEYVEPLTDGKKDKGERFIEVTMQDESKVTIKGLLDCDYSKLANILQMTSSEFDEYKEEKQLIPIDEMAESVKTSYIQIIINMAYDDHNAIDKKELAEILSLMSRLDLTSESRFTLLSYMSSLDELTPLQQLLERIDVECPSGQINMVHISLIKDLINLFFSTGNSSVQDFAFLQNNRKLFKVTDEEIELAVMAIQNDYNMMKDDMTDDQIVRALKALSAKAAAVGTPLAAVYLSGSVVGMSAAGLTSGLAALGMGGLLGLSSMATGIGVAVLIGVGTYAGMRKLTGANELTQNKRRELMLNEVIKQTQSTISLLIQDINFITIKMNDTIKCHGAQSETIKKLMRLLTQMTGAGHVLTEKSDAAQSSATKLRCAKFLDDNKLKSLTKEPTKSALYDFIKSFYEERVFIQEKDGQKKEITKMAMKAGHTTKDLEELANAFEIIGYFKVADVLKGTAADAAGKAKDKIAGFFS